MCFYINKTDIVQRIARKVGSRKSEVGDEEEQCLVFLRQLNYIVLS